MNLEQPHITMPNIRQLTEAGTLVENIEPIKLTSQTMVCIDGRQKREGVFAGPGGSLGFVIAILDAANKSGLATTKQDYITLFANIEKELGPITWHSDDHNHDSAALACAGCGHCNGILTNPDKYEVDPLLTTTIKEILSALSPEDADTRCDTLSGNHEESAVVVIPNNPPTITLPGTTSHGQTFVYHKDVWEDNLEQIAAAVFADEELSIIQRVTDSVVASSNRQLGITVVALGADKLPQYSINSNGDVPTK